MTCSPLLAHLRDGMQSLSDQIEQDKNNKRLQDFISKGLIAGKAEHAAPGQSADEPARKRVPSNPAQNLIWF